MWSCWLAHQVAAGAPGLSPRRQLPSRDHGRCLSPGWLESEAPGRGWGPGRRDKLAVAMGTASRAANPDPGQGAGPLDSDVRPGPGRPGPWPADGDPRLSGQRAESPAGHSPQDPAPSTGCSPVLGLPWLLGLGGWGKSWIIERFLVPNVEAVPGGPRDPVSTTTLHSLLRLIHEGSLDDSIYYWQGSY